MIIIDIKQMRYFVTIVKEGGMTEAADHLFISQPTISKAIRDIEDELDVKLFDRGKRRLSLTDAGKVLFDQCEEILRLHEKLPVDLKNMVGIYQGQLKIGLPPLMNVSKLIKVMKEFHENYPQVTFQLIEGGSRSIEDLLEKNEIDLGITVLPTEGRNFDTYHFIHEPLILVAHPEHPLVSRNSIQLAELESEQLIMFDEDFYLNEIIMSACKSAGFVPDIIAWTAQWKFIEEMVDANLGVCILPKSSASMLDPSFVTVEITHPELYWRLGIVWNKHQHMAALTKEWLKFFEYAYHNDYTNDN